MAAPQGQLESAYDPTLCPLKPYPEMTDSGLKWLGDVPAHWQIRRLKSVVHQVSEQAGILQEGMPYVALENVESWTGRVTPNCAETTESQLKCFESGDVLFGKLRPYLAKVTRMNSRGQCVGEFLVLRVTDQISGYFLEHLLRSKPVIDWINSSTFGARMPRADWQFVGNTRLAVPPPPEQTAITRFLDHTTSKIERYIRAKQKLISLLEEQKQVIIHQAVTGQIDVRTGQPYPAYKPSGVEWLGNVPVNWEIQRAKRLFSLRTEKSGSAHGLELLSIYTHIGVRPRKDLEEKGNKASTTDDYWIVKPGDLITNKLLAWMGAIGVSHYYGVTSPAYDILMPIVDLESDYYHLLFRTPTYLQQFKQYSRGIMDMRLRLYFDQFGQIPVTVPRIEDQQAIVEFCDKSTIRLNDNIQRTIRQVDLLREYRTRLIADVITGKVDVREAAAELPQIDSETHEDGENSILSEPHSLNTRHDKEQEARL